VNDRDDDGLVRSGFGGRGGGGTRDGALPAARDQEADAGQGDPSGDRPGERRHGLGRWRRGGRRGRRRRRAAEEKDRVAAGEAGEPRGGQQVGRRADRRLRGGDHPASRGLHDVGADGRAAAGATRGDDGVAHDHAHEGELLAVGTPPLLVVEQVDHRRAVDARAEGGVERAQLGGGPDLALDGAQVRLFERPIAIRLGTLRRFGLGVSARRQARGHQRRGNRRRNQNATDESLDLPQGVASNRLQRIVGKRAYLDHGSP
jgi:hypothetical protein